jgi:hypothetical protein
MKVTARRALLESLGVLTLIAATVFFVATSWRRWPDPLIDFGQELYNAWQISNGAVLYRDIGCLYGPLSEYCNAAIFWVFGPGLIVLAIANLVVFVAITTAVYLLFRRSWGPFAAWISTLIFISVFGFSQFVDAGNYNYAAPYAQETIHGMLLCLILCLLLHRSIEKSTAGGEFICGVLLGATVVLKPEFIIAAVAITGLAALARWKQECLPNLRSVAWWAIGALLPTLLFTVYFAQFFSWARAFLVSSRAWLSVFESAHNSSPLAIRLLGFDHPWSRFITELTGTTLACVVILALFGATVLVNIATSRWFRSFVTFISLLVFGWLGCYVVNWIEVGQCLFGLTLLYLLISIGSLLVGSSKSKPDRDIRTLRILIAGLAIALMARMFLNPRIYHYGYYQAALAAILPPAIMVSELPNWCRKGGAALLVAAVGTLALVLPGITNLALRSQRALALKIQPIAAGRDRFYCFPAQMDSIGGVVSAVIGVLREKGHHQTLTVLPEGESINYFARLRNPVPHACFYRGAMETQTESELVEDLQRTSPYWIVIISRDLIGWGIERYGENTESGEEVLTWVRQNYKQVASIGGDPLDYHERGAIIFRSYSR